MSESVLASLDAPTNEGDSGAGLETATSAGVAGGSPSGSAAAESQTAGTGADSAGGAQAAQSAKAPDASGERLVPLAALQESREHIKALKTQITELEKRPWLSTEDADLLKDLKAQRKAVQEPKTPEFLDDPKGYIDAKEKQFQEAVKKLSESDTKRAEAEQQQQQLQQLIGTVSAHESAFVAKTPDYQEALSHMRTVRSNQLRMLFPQANDQQIQAQIGREELAGAHQILQSGGNPAEFAYNYAKTLGYTPKQAQTAAITAALGNGAAQPEQQEKPDKDAVRTLGGGGGAEGDEAPEDPMPEFTQAIKEKFARRRK